MINEKLEIKLCLGSSCYARGNNVFLELIKDYLKKNGLKDKVDFRGELCSENCNKGPVIKINNKPYFNVKKDELLKLLDELFKDYPSSPGNNQ